MNFAAGVLDWCEGFAAFSHRNGEGLFFSAFVALFFCVHVNVLPIDTQKGNNRPKLLQDTRRGLLHISFPGWGVNKLLVFL